MTDAGPTGNTDAMSDLHFHDLTGGTRIAYRFTAGLGPARVFLPGYKSDMTGNKACAVFDQAKAQGRSCLLLDYSGCGQSSGRFADGSLSLWRDEVINLIDNLCPGPVMLIGSSMGGWLMLLVALARPDQVAALIGIAAAPDFTQWGYDAAQQTALARGQPVFEANPYDPEPIPTYPGFWADGQAQRLLAKDIAITCPVRLLHGQEDADVPWKIALELAAAVRSADVQVALVKDGDHRLSRETDIALLLRMIADLS